MKIKEVMSEEFSGVTPDTALEDAIKFMNADLDSCALITDGDSLFGIFTERDVVELLASDISPDERLNFLARPIAEFMTQSPLTVTANSDVLEVIMIAQSHGIRHFPVLDEDEKLVGLVTQAHIMDAYSKLIKTLARLKANNQALHELALEDALMQIGNRRAMEIDLKYSQSASKRRDEPYAIAIFDVDFFKRYNDTYGHQKGDEALVNLAKIIKSVIRESDRIYRYGGEEILVLMPQTDQKQAMEVSIRVRQAVANLRIEHESSDLGYLTISGGVAAGTGNEWTAMIKAADKMLYIAKSSGRNQVCVA